MISEKTKVILHAEDEPAHAAIVRMAIKRNIGDVHLRQVDNGMAALDYLYRIGPYEDIEASPRPDLILLDLRMPLMGGLDVLAAVKKNLELKSIPVVILTTSDIEEEQSEATARGADGYLTKPIDFDKFISMINTLCVTWL